MEELDLKQLIEMFWIRKIQIFLIILLFMLIGGAYSFFLVVPKYKSSTTLVLAKAEDENTYNNASITQTEITLNQKLVSTYSELIKSQAILNQVIENLELTDVSEDYLRKNVAVNAVKDTELIKITVTHENNTYVKIMADEIAKVFSEKVGDIYKISNVYVVDKAQETNIPYNINHFKDVAIFMLIGAVVSAIYVLISNILDNTVKTAKDIEEVTELFVLGTIPRYDFEAKEKGGI